MSLSYDCRPFLYEDHRLLLWTPHVRREHGRLRADPDSGHDGFSPDRCGECAHLAYLALCELAVKARGLGFDRARALEKYFAANGTIDASGRAVTNPDGYVARGLNNAAIDARRRVDGADGRREVPRACARGARYRRALTDARRAGRLSVDVPAAVELLGLIIEAVQDPTTAVEAGELVSWSSIENRLADGPYAYVAARGAHRLWLEIEQAILAHPPAAQLLGGHVYRYSQNRTRHTIEPWVSEEGEEQDPIAEATEEQSITATTGATPFEQAVAATARGLARRDTTDAETALALARRAFADAFGPDLEGAEVESLIRLIAERALAEVDDHRNRHRELEAVIGAAISLDGHPRPTHADERDAVTAALAAKDATHPYDLETDAGRRAYEQWLDSLARDVLWLTGLRRRRAS
jgi:hypothetical protein